jgi:hypothetical protein
MVQNLDLSHPEFDGVLFTGIVKEPVRNLDVGSETARAMQAYLPIGPSCC